MARVYPKAPIFEAVIDLKVGFPSQPSQKAFDEFAAQLADAYPVVTQITRFQVDLNTSSESKEVTTDCAQETLGVRLTSSDGKRIVQAQRAGLTYSFLSPYSNWEAFSEAAWEVWSKYLHMLKPNSVSRVAVRFINKIAIPATRFELEEYFNIYPKLPSSIPQDYTGVFLQMHMPQFDIGGDALAIVNFGSTRSDVAGSSMMILDFDVFRKRQYVADSAEILSDLNSLRDRKNELFEACVTDKCRELFQ